MDERKRRHLSAVGPDDTPATPGKPCLVMSDDEWWAGTLTWESARRADGLWWATVTYDKNGQTISEVRSQHDIRAR